MLVGLRLGKQDLQLILKASESSYARLLISWCRSSHQIRCCTSTTPRFSNIPCIIQEVAELLTVEKPFEGLTRHRDVPATELAGRPRSLCRQR